MIRIDACSPSAFSMAGGDLIVVSGEFPVSTPLTVELSGQRCHGGTGRGYAPMSDDGAVLLCVAPPVPKGEVSLEITDGVDSDSILVDVCERSWPVKLQRIRRSFPPEFGVGARNFNSEPRQ
ncbi:MAG: hypothetical protein MUC88_00480 [Planctomycetes bacterium]|jgi:hypothetical protein|nr:hypothetical protein [Planctomycetota bacterium]